jgi:hypothetical protein
MAEDNTQAWHLFLNICLGDLEGVQACINNGVIERCVFKDTLFALAIANSQTDILQIFLEHPQLSNLQKLQRETVIFTISCQSP